MRKPLEFAVSGYYGCGNAGDEAVLAGIHESFVRRAGAGVNLTVLSQDPLATTSLHGLAAAERMNLGSLSRTLRASNMLLCGGGSLLQDTTSMRSLLYYLWVVRMAMSRKVPVMFYAQGIGPLRRPLSRSLVRLVANRVAAITVRDQPSAQLLREIGVIHPSLEVTADPAFALSPAPDRLIDELMTTEQIPLDEPLIGVALRPWGGTGESPVTHYARLIERLSQECDSRVVLLPMQVPGDVAFAEEVARQTNNPGLFPIVLHAYPPATLFGLVSRMQAVVAMRLHALIFAAHAATIPFALAYDPKVDHLMRDLGLDDAMDDWRAFDPEMVARKVAGMIADRPRLVASLRARKPELERRALRNADRALEFFA